MGIIKDRFGTYHARKKVPKKAEAAVAKVTGSAKLRVAWLKRSLGTKDLRQANVRAKSVLMEFDRILEKASASLATRPLRSDLSQREMERIATYHYAMTLGNDEVVRTRGLSLGEFNEEKANNAELLEVAKHALATGDVDCVADFIDELLDLFDVNLDRSSPAYRKLGMTILAQDVEALTSLEQRNAGVHVKTPRVDKPAAASDTPEGGTLRAALIGWEKGRRPAASSLREYTHAVSRFEELHGNLSVSQISRSHVRAFREALQSIPVRRAGLLRKAPIQALVEWSSANPSAQKLSAGTINKLLGGVQAISVWARDNGLIPDTAPWADPFANMRLEENEPEREPWELEELKTLFAAPVFTSGKRPKGGGGEAAYWLPLLALYSGARLGELVPLRASDMKQDEASGVRYFSIVEDEKHDKSLKTQSSRRVTPWHPELIRLGFADFVERARKAHGTDAMLFPQLKTGSRGDLVEKWSKWFGRYIRQIGIGNSARVFHSFRHSFKDALRAGGVDEELNDALTGHSGGGVGRKYGAKDMARRFGGFGVLAEAVTKAQFPGLELGLSR